MTGIAGGLRARLVQDSLSRFVVDGLTSLGWLDPGRRHLPVRVVAKPPRWDEPVVANAIALSFEMADLDDLELGSALTRTSAAATFDLYVESDSLAVDLANDIRDLLRGRLRSPRHGVIELVDWSQATPVTFGYATVSDVRVHRPVALASQDWRRHWVQVTCVVDDDYTDEQG